MSNHFSGALSVTGSRNICCINIIKTTLVVFYSRVPDSVVIYFDVPTNDITFKDFNKCLYVACEYNIEALEVRFHYDF